MRVRFCSSIMMLAILWGCTDKPYVPEKSIEIGGRAELGNPIVDANVTAFRWGKEGRGELLASTKTNEGGEYGLKFESQYRGAVLLELSGGNYVDLATGDEVELKESDSLLSFWNTNEESPKRSINMWTTLAVKFVQSTIEDNGDVESAVNTSKKKFSLYLSNTETPVEFWKAVSREEGSEETSATSDSAILFLTHAGLSQLASERSLSAVSLIDSLEQDKKSEELAYAIPRFVFNATKNGKDTRNFSVAQLKEPRSISHILCQHAGMFSDKPVVGAFALNPPKLEIDFSRPHVGFEMGALLAGNVGMVITATDSVGIGSLKVLYPADISVVEQTNDLMRVEFAEGALSNADAAFEECGQQRAEEIDVSLVCICAEAVNLVGEKTLKVHCFGRKTTDVDVGEGETEEPLGEEEEPVCTPIPRAIFVDAKSKAESPDGSNWKHAYKRINDAVNAARSRQSQPGYGVVNIAIKVGTYNASTEYLNNEDPLLNLSKTKDMKFIGGFGGDRECLEDSHKSRAGQTVLDGEGTRRIIYVLNDRKTRLHGNLTFERLAFLNGKTDKRGGAFYLYSAKNISINDSILKNNAALFGGAIYLDHGKGFQLSRNTVVSNTSNISGGALESNNFSAVQIIENTFLDNTSDTGGAISLSSGKNISVNRNKFTSNIAEDTGGGAVSVTGTSSFKLKGNEFNKNRAARGGAFYGQNINGSNLDGNNYIGNIALESGGAVHLWNVRDINLRRCKFIDNEADEGGAVYLRDNKRINFRGSSFENNRANIGGAIAVAKWGEPPQGLDKPAFTENLGKESQGFPNGVFVK